MENFFTIVLSAVVASLFLLPVIIALVLAAFAANIFSLLLKPITDPVHRFTEAVSQMIPNPLDRIPLFPSIKRHFGSTKNILFIGFVIIFLIIHYLSMGRVDNIFDNLSLLFPGSAIEQVANYGGLIGNFSISSFLVDPSTYLQTVLYSFISGLFLHIGCTTRAPDAKINIFVKLLYTLLITLFSSIVLGMLPPDLFTFSLSDFSLGSAVSDGFQVNSDVVMFFGILWDWGSILFRKMIDIIPALVAVYFLCQSISGFAASYLGGFVALFSVALGWPDGFADVNSFQSVFLLLLILTIGEVVALAFGEFVNKAAELTVEEHSELFEYYNIVSLLISYFFYPILVISLLCIIGLFVNGFDIAIFLVALLLLFVFSLSVFVGYKINRCTLTTSEKFSGTNYAVAMVFNIPIWIIYLAIL